MTTIASKIVSDIDPAVCRALNKGRGLAPPIGLIC